MEYQASFINIMFLNYKKVTRTEFYFILMQCMETPAHFFKKCLKGDTDTAKGIEALMIFKERFDRTVSIFEKRFLIVDMLKKSEDTLTFYMVCNMLADAAEDFIVRGMPKRSKELAVTGDMFIELKMFKQGKELGMKLQQLFEDVITEKRFNTVEDLLK
jgi:hypothetical protein